MIWTRQLVAIVLAVSISASQGATTKPGSMGYPLLGMPAVGSYWTIYNATAAPAADKCLVEEGKVVDETCCTSVYADTIPHASLQGHDTCFELGPGLVPFSGCVDNGVAGYGENCSGEGAPFAAPDAKACGCSFVIEGSGCYKANDIPGQQWFVYLDGASCKVSSNGKGKGTMKMMKMRMMGKGKGMSTMASKGKGSEIMSKGKGKGSETMSKGKGKGYEIMSKGKGKGYEIMSKGKGKGSSMTGKGKGSETMSKGTLMKMMVAKVKAP